MKFVKITYSKRKRDDLFSAMFRNVLLSCKAPLFLLYTSPVWIPYYAEVLITASKFLDSIPDLI
jgi:hypothetical protein